MPKRQKSEVPALLERTRQRFERWRETREGRARIPESLWNAAVKMAGRYGIFRTCKTLRLSYYALKKRVEQENSSPRVIPPKNENGVSFVELTVPSRDDRAECVLELEDAAGAKMRVHLQGLEAPDLVALCRGFWGAGQ